MTKMNPIPGLSVAIKILELNPDCLNQTDYLLLADEEKASHREVLTGVYVKDQNKLVLPPLRGARKTRYLWF